MSKALISSLKFSKIVGAGNDFLFIDARTALPQAFASIPREEIARKLCHRNFGAGADGLVFVENAAKPGRFKWDFFNSDGSAAEMCGNASRCMGRWAETYLHLAEIELETIAGLVRTQADKTDVAALLDYVKVSFTPLTYRADGLDDRKATLVNTGVPHAVVQVDSIADPGLHFASHIKALRFHPDSGPRGANVTFLRARGAADFDTVTFERGVEGFTLSCGTGVLAAAAVGLRQSQLAEARLMTPGGEMQVQFGKEWSGAVLKGAAKFLFETSVAKEFFE